MHVHDCAIGIVDNDVGSIGRERTDVVGEGDGDVKLMVVYRPVSWEICVSD